jgi:hypothetical protein
MIDKIKYMIDLYDLTSSSRQRHLVYMRAYLYFELSKLKINKCEIGRMFQRDHASVIHGLKVHKTYYKKDKIYNDSIADVRYYLYPSDVEHKYSIFEDVIKCNNTTDLKIIKDRIANNQYLER